jgi:hypothetical protein
MIYNMIFFGAGASKGSDNTEVPPLGPNLFDELVTFNRNGWGQIPSEFSEYFTNDFEEGMEVLSESHPDWMSKLQRAMAAYFFNFYPQSSSLYRKLARRIKKSNWTGVLASINYERLLELSLIEEGLQPFIGCPSENVNKIELCLPHGCCHLFCESVKADSSAVSFNARCITTRGSVVAISSLSEFQRRIDTDAFPPVMSYFEPEKTTTSGVNFIERQRSRFSETTSNAVIIIIIGVKVRPNENHIWGPTGKDICKTNILRWQKKRTRIR